MEVLRGPGAEGCPSGDEFLELLSRFTDASSPPPSGRFAVEFARSASPVAWTATITALGTPGVGSVVRTLQDTSPTCDALGQAAVVALLVLIDPEPAHAPPFSVSAALDRGEPSGTDSPLSTRATPSEHKPLRMNAIVGAGGALSVTSKVAPALGAGAELLAASGVSLRTQFLWLPRFTVSLRDASVSALASQLEVCAQVLAAKRQPRLSTCLDATLGQLRIERSAGSATTGWGTAGGGFRLDGPAGAAGGWWVKVAGLVRVTSSTVEIDDISWKPEPVGLLFQGGALLKIL